MKKDYNHLIGTVLNGLIVDHIAIKKDNQERNNTMLFMRCLECGASGFVALNTFNNGIKSCKYFINKHEIINNDVKMFFHNGSHTIISLEDYGIIRNTKYTIDINSGYITRQAGKDKIYLHREIMSNICEKIDVVDHINGNRSDNRRSNLRNVTSSQNSKNQKNKSIGSSRYKGVYLNKATGRWVARIKVDYQSTHIGTYDSEIQAAIAYDNHAEKFHKEYAKTNKSMGLL